jgi:proteasome-associated ATPase
MSYETDRIRTLEMALREAMVKIVEQNKFATRLTTIPQLYGVVVAVYETDKSETSQPQQPPEQQSEQAKPTDPRQQFVVGANIKYLPDGRMGSIVRETIDEDGRVYIRLNSGGEGWIHLFDRDTHFRTLVSRPELALVENFDEETDPRQQFVEGARIQGTSSSSFPGIAGIIDRESIDTDGEVHIKLDNGGGGWIDLFDPATRYRTLVSRPQLTLSGETDPRQQFVVGAKVIGTAQSGYEGRTGYISEETIRQDGQVYVKFDDGEEDWFSLFDPRSNYRRLLNPTPFEVSLEKKISLPKMNEATDFVDVIVDSRLMRLLHPGVDIYAGDVVILSSQTMQILEVKENHSLNGPLAIMSNFVGETINDDFLFEVSENGTKKIVYAGSFDRQNTKIGDKLMLDPSGCVVIDNLGQEDIGFQIEEVHIDWDEVGGQEQAKRVLREAVETPALYSGLYEAYHKKPIGGVLLVGPHGCGKTRLAMAVATAKGKQHNGSSGKFLYIKGPELLSRFVGDTELMVRMIFAFARNYYAEHGVGIVIFFDEAESIFLRRGAGISSDVNNTIVPQLLSEMNGFQEHHALILLASNRGELIDPAVTRPGRIDRIVYVGRPNEQDTKDIFHIHAHGVPLNNGYTHADLADLLSTELFSRDRVLYNISTKTGSVRQFKLGDVVSGAMVAGILDHATSIALNRDITNGGKTAGGLCREDVVQAVVEVYGEQQQLDHSWELSEFVHGWESDVTSIQKF